MQEEDRVILQCRLFSVGGVWLVRQYPSHLGMQYTALNYTSHVHLCKFISPNAVAALAISLFHTWAVLEGPAVPYKTKKLRVES